MKNWHWTICLLIAVASARGESPALRGLVNPVWQITNQQAVARGPEITPRVYIAPATLTLLARQDLVVVDAASGEVLHRIALPGEAEESGLAASAFLRVGDRGIAVLLRHDVDQADTLARERVFAIGLDGQELWQTNFTGEAIRALQATPGPAGEDRLLLIGEKFIRLFSAAGKPLLEKPLGADEGAQISKGPAAGQVDLLSLGDKPALYRWTEPPPALPTEESP